ncbi:hypothetical protein ACIB24_00465 [Spongisporangium articulatum]|uniref:Uncharacterized protein n=1 Tax=Spongisporangium articulatum TaxID=3362603 RepID=A0ABW8AH86_9ACTN
MATVLVTICLTACTAPADHAPPAATPTVPTTRGATATTPEPTPEPTLTPVRAWRPVRGEVHVKVKRAAVRAVEAAGTWDADGGTPSARFQRRFAAPGASASTVDVTYPQMGGLTATEASVMVVGVQALLDERGHRRTKDFTVDVRLDVHPDGSATVTGIEKPVDVPDGGALSAAARKLLRNENVTLPGAAADDVRSGSLDDGLLRVLDGLGQEHELSVLDLHTGHPHNVFATDRVSNHTQGRAVDIWAIDGTPVVQAPRALLSEVMRTAGELGATEVGGPFDYNGAGPGYFTDAVHLDHIHVGITAGRQGLG